MPLLTPNKTDRQVQHIRDRANAIPVKLTDMAKVTRQERTVNAYNKDISNPKETKNKKMTKVKTNLFINNGHA